jgi:hypothetical protein
MPHLRCLSSFRILFIIVLGFDVCRQIILESIIYLFAWWRGAAFRRGRWLPGLSGTGCPGCLRLAGNGDREDAVEVAELVLQGADAVFELADELSLAA